MAINIQVEQELNATAQFVKDERGNTILLALSTDAVGIGTKSPLSIAAPANLDVKGGARFYSELNSGQPGVELLYRTDTNWSRILSFDRQTNQYVDLFIEAGGDAIGVMVKANGSVGIGTTNPREKLEVHGNILATGDVKLAGADCAEDFDVDDPLLLEPGMVMVINDEEKLSRCALPYDHRVAGVLSGAGDYRPGIVLDKRAEQADRLPLALTGKVYCKVDADYSPVAVGDLLTTSSTPGYAMKASDPSKAFGAVLGKALRPLAQGCGLIPVLVALH